VIKFSSRSPSFSLLRTRGSLFPRELAVPDQCYATVGEGFGEYIIRGYGTDFSLPGRPFCQRITTSNSSSAWRELQANIMLSDQVHADVVSDVLVTGGVVSFFFLGGGMANKNAHRQHFRFACTYNGCSKTFKRNGNLLGHPLPVAFDLI
jgi:hypothetical protein